MAHGYFCSRCMGTVDNNEFDFRKGICKECVEKAECGEIRKAEAVRLAGAYAVQIEMEDIFGCRSN